MNQPKEMIGTKRWSRGTFGWLEVAHVLTIVFLSFFMVLVNVFAQVAVAKCQTGGFQQQKCVFSDGHLLAGPQMASPQCVHGLRDLFLCPSPLIRPPALMD